MYHISSRIVSDYSRLWRLFNNSAHGVPESYIAAGDPYKKQIEECVRLVSKVSEWQWVDGVLDKEMDIVEWENKWMDMIW